ncbi:hypothetical protein ACWEBX_40805, partial [Streptomyces sp. NPDC005070]
MPTWTRTLREAGITEPGLRAAYGKQRTFVRRFRTAEYLTVRLLLPTRLHPPVIAAVAFMHETDERVDTGTRAARNAALESWASATRAVLDGATAPDATGPPPRPWVCPARSTERHAVPVLRTAELPSR